MNETEDSEVIEVEVRAYRRKIRRERYRRTCDCPNESQTLTAPAPPKLIPKGRYGVSVWVYLLLAKFASHRALGNAIEALSHYDLDLPQGTITDGLKRISPLGPRATRLHWRRQRLAGACRLGHCVAASYSPFVPSESAAALTRTRNAPICRPRRGLAAKRWRVCWITGPA